MILHFLFNMPVLEEGGGGDTGTLSDASSFIKVQCTLPIRILYHIFSNPFLCCSHVPIEEAENTVTRSSGGSAASPHPGTPGAGRLLP